MLSMLFFVVDCGCFLLFVVVVAVVVVVFSDVPVRRDIVLSCFVIQ